MKKIARFEKVSYEQFKKDLYEQYGFMDSYIKKFYGNLNIPKRATKGSAGHDIFSPISFELPYGKSLLIPTGIKCEMNEGWVLQIYPRSSVGFKYGIRLSNTVGIIDKDYYNNENNEGHIFIKLTNNDSTQKKTLTIKKGEAFAQAVFLPYGVADDGVTTKRNGGIGSTNINY